MKLKWSTVLAAVLLSAVLLVPAHATTIISFSDNHSDYTMTLSGGPTDTLTISATVTGISFSGTGWAGCTTGNCSATFVLTASSTTLGTDVGGFDVQGGYGGTFAFSNLFDSNTLAVINPGTFLAGTFGSATLSGSDGGNTATFQVSDQANCAQTNSCNAINILTSTYWYLFTPPNDNSQSLSISLTSFQTVGDGGLSLSGYPTGYVNNATASGGGTMSSTIYTPEPSTMLLLGGALIGLGVIGRKRRKSV